MKVHGCHPFRQRAGALVVWNFPDAIPQHREPIYGTWPDLVAKYPAQRPQDVLAPAHAVHLLATEERCREAVREFPIILTSGRLVEYEGGGEETRSNPGWPNCSRRASSELNPKAAADRGIRNGDRVWVLTPTGARLNVQALVTERVGPIQLSCRSPSRVTGGAWTCWPAIRRRGAYRARRSGQHGHHVRLRLRDDDAETKTPICNIEKA